MLEILHSAGAVFLTKEVSGIITISNLCIKKKLGRDYSFRLIVKRRVELLLSKQFFIQILETMN